MWVCKTHVKEALPLLETPHVSKAVYQIRCSLCENLAVAKVYYTHQTCHFSKKQLNEGIENAKCLLSRGS